MFEGILHDSIGARFRAPFGAVPCGTDVRLSIRVPDPAVRARLRLWVGNAERIVEGRRAGDYYEFLFQAKHTGLIWYYFLLEAPGVETPGVETPGVETRYYGGRSGAGAVYDYPPPSYQITVYDPAFQTPAWFREGIAYQVFADRFHRSGERGGLARTEYHRALGRSVALHEEWNAPVLYEPLPGKKDYDPCDFYGGDLRGLAEKLPYLKSLGVTCLYLNPIFESPTNHRYNTSDYLRVDPVLGDEGDLRMLVAAAKEAGMHIILDGVFSHTGDDSVYFNRYGRYPGPGAYQSRESPYFEWYDFRAWPDSYRAWWGFPTLPEVNELTPSYMEFVAGVLSHYAALGLTSWRLDVADELPDEFIVFLRARLKAIDPEGLLLGEVWDDASNKEGFGARRAYVDGAELDSVMNYPLRGALCDFFLYRTDANGLAARLFALRENYPKPFYDACLNLLGSHDTPRIATVLGGAPHRDALTREEQARFRLSPDAAARGKARLALAQMLLFSHPGVPCTYYGDEIGMFGMADPFCRAPYPWGAEDEAQLAQYRRIAAARRASKALSEGACGFAALTPDLFAILRTAGGESALTLVNRSERAERVMVAAEAFRRGPDGARMFLAPAYTEAITGMRITCSEGTLNLVLPPLSGAMLISEKSGEMR